MDPKLETAHSRGALRPLGHDGFLGVPEGSRLQWMETWRCRGRSVTLQ